MRTRTSAYPVGRTPLSTLNDEPAEYGIEGRKDVEMAMAIYESSLNRMAPIGLPLTAITGYERAVHEDFQAQFGRPVGDV